MSKFTEFYTKLFDDKEARKKLSEILENKLIEQADDSDLKKIRALAGTLGVEISVEEAKQFFTAQSGELEDEALDAVAGGKGEELKFHYIYCEIGGSPDANK